MPNRIVDVNSWMRSACYPRRTFYPMSDGPSIRDHRITSTYFRICSRCLSCSQAPLCACTQRLVSNQPEGTFACLRYSLGGDRPSQTAHLTMSPALIQRRRLEFQYRKDGIPTATPQPPKRLFPSVPSILCMQHRNPILGYSKAPWGLSVLSRVTGIFTGTTISPGGLLRQCPNHYAFHAGQNLPDKEFRYLRTVIVTAAVHWGFDSMLAHLLLTFQHRAGVSSYTSSFDLAQTCVFGKQLLGPILCGSISGAPLLPKLRGQFAEFLNNPSPVGLRIFFLPTCVGLRYGHRRNTHSFSRHLPSRTSVLISLDRYRNQHPAPRLQMCPCV